MSWTAWLEVATCAGGWAGTAIAAVVAWRYRTAADGANALALARAAALVEAKDSAAADLARCEERRVAEVGELRDVIQASVNEAEAARLRHEAEVKGLLKELAEVEVVYASNPAAARLRLVRLLQGTRASDYTGD